MSTKRSLGVLIAVSGTALALSGMFAGSASALTYDGQDPIASGCANTAITAESVPIRDSNGALLGYDDLRYSTACRTTWGRVRDIATSQGSSLLSRLSDGHQEWCGYGPLTWSQTLNAYTCYTPMLNDANVTSISGDNIYSNTGSLLGSAVTPAY